MRFVTLCVVFLSVACQKRNPSSENIRATEAESPTSVVVTTPPPRPSPTPAATPAPRPVPQRTNGLQVARWENAEIRPSETIRLDKAVAQFERDRSRYETIERMRPGGVPAPVIFGLHGRESTWSFTRHLHEGSPLSGRTKFVPKGRPLTPDPPYTFEQSAEDALYVLKSLHRKDWTDAETALQTIEAYNGLGYQKYHSAVPSPYLWAGTTLYSRGKYVADGKFDGMAVDKQLGVAAILKRMQERGIAIPFDG